METESSGERKYAAAMEKHAATQERIHKVNQ
jgi:hypothetical protein